VTTGCIAVTIIADVLLLRAYIHLRIDAMQTFDRSYIRRKGNRVNITIITANAEICGQ